MSFLSAIWNLIKKIFSAVLGWIKKIFSKLFWIILILVVIWYAPFIAAYLVEIGAPTFMVSMFDAIAVLTPYVQAAGEWLWSQGSSLISTGWKAYRGLDAGTQAAIALGVSAAIAPEETAAVLSEAGKLAASAIGSLASGVMSTPVGLILGGAALWFFLFRNKSSQSNEQTHEPLPQGA